VTIVIVDVLEVVDVDESQGEAGPVTVDQFGHGMLQVAPVGQPRQVVEMGAPEQFRFELLLSPEVDRGRHRMGGAIDRDGGVERPDLGRRGRSGGFVADRSVGRPAKVEADRSGAEHEIGDRDALDSAVPEAIRLEALGGVPAIAEAPGNGDIRRLRNHRRRPFDHGGIDPFS